MKNIIIKLMWFVSSILLIVTGFICAFNPSITLESMALLFGMVVLLSGLFDIIIYIKIRKMIPDSGWTLAEGILTIILSIFILLHQEITAFTIPLIFTVWILFAGISRIISSFDLKQYGIKNWWILLIVGVSLTILSISSIFKPVLAAFALSFIVGIILISQGIDYLVKGYYVNKIIKNIKEIEKVIK